MASPPDNSPKTTRQRKRTEKKVGAKGLPCAQHPKTNLATRCPPRSPIKPKKKKKTSYCIESKDSGLEVLRKKMVEQLIA